MVCGSPVVASADLLRRLAGECAHVVAVDRGLDSLLGVGLGCDVYVGDADTVSDTGRALVAAATDFEVARHDYGRSSGHGAFRTGVACRL